MTYHMAVSMFPATTQTHVFTTIATKATSWLEIHTECVVMMAHGTRKHQFAKVSDTACTLISEAKKIELSYSLIAIIWY